MLSLLLSGGSFLFDKDGSLTNPVADFLGWQRLNETFFRAHPEASALKSYPPLWPHVEFLAAAGLTADFQNLLLQNTVPAYQGKYYYSLVSSGHPPTRADTKEVLMTAGAAISSEPSWRLSHAVPSGSLAPMRRSSR